MLFQHEICDIFKATHSHILGHHVQELEISILWTNKYYLSVCVYTFLQHGLRLGGGKVGVFNRYSLLISHELKKMLIVNFSIVKLLTATSVNLFRFPFFFWETLKSSPNRT